MKKLFIICILFCSFTAVLSAQDKAADIKRLLEVMESQKMMDLVTSQVSGAFLQQARASIQGEEQKAKYDKFAEYVMQEGKNMSMKILNEEVVKSYDKYFTQQEIKELIKLHENPVMKKVLKLTPEINQEMMSAVTTKYLPEYQAKIMQKMNELK